MRLAIVGSRTFPDHVVEDYVKTLPLDTVVVTGGWRAYQGARIEPTAGVDRAAWRAAEKHGLVTVLCVGSKTKHGNGAGLQRNPVIVDLSDWVVAFWDLKSPGTRNTLSYAQSKGKQVFVVGPEGTRVDGWARYLRACI